MPKRQGKLKATEYLTSDEILQALQTLLSSQGWKIISDFVEEDVKRVEQNIKSIELEILDGKDISEKELIRLKEKRAYQKELIKTHIVNIPQMIIEQIKELKESGDNKPIELDPYDLLTNSYQ